MGLLFVQYALLAPLHWFTETRIDGSRERERERESVAAQYVHSFCLGGLTDCQSQGLFVEDQHQLEARHQRVASRKTQSTWPHLNYHLGLVRAS